MSNLLREKPTQEQTKDLEKAIRVQYDQKFSEMNVRYKELEASLLSVHQKLASSAT